MKQKRGRKRRGKTRSCDMEERSKRRRKMRKFRRKRGAMGESRSDTGVRREGQSRKGRERRF